MNIPKVERALTSSLPEGFAASLPNRIVSEELKAQIGTMLKR